MNGDPAELVGKTLGQRYRLERVIGAGGMGAVYEATQVDLGRAVAVKVLIDVDPRGIARLRQEAFAAGSSSCPHVISIFDFQTPPGEPPFIVMELLPGHSLAKLLERERSLPVPRAVRIAQQMLIALEAAHRAGVVHRDIKPSNTWLVHGPGVEEHVKVLDFGIAKVLGDGPSLRTTTGSVLGTPSYLSPEQLCGTPVDARTDIHAMGIVLFEMVSGRRPWNPRAHVYGEIRDRVPPPLHEVAPHAPLELSHIVARALAKDPAGRFARAADMRAALEPFVGQVVSSPATALGAALGTGTVGSSPGPYSATRDERGAYPAPVATATMGGGAASTIGSAPPTFAPAAATGPLAAPAYAYGAPTFQAPAVPHGVPATLTSTSQSLPPPQQQPFAPPPLAPAPPARSRSLALPFLLGGGVVILLGGLAAAAFVIGHYSASSSRSGASADPSARPVAVSSDAGGGAPASSAADAGTGAGAAAAAAAGDGRKSAGGARSGAGAGGAPGGGAPATAAPGAVTAASAAAAAVGPISPRCECENRNGGIICTTTKVPNCGCHVTHNLGVPICPVRFDAKGNCSVRAPGDLLPYSAPGKKDGDPCSGFDQAGTPATGELSCQPCYGRDRFAAVEGTVCKGVHVNGVVGEGKWVCEK